MKLKPYNIFLFLSTLARNLIEVFSLVLLYEKGFSIKEILFFLLILYISGIIVNYISLKINYKIVLILSNILYPLSFIYLNYINNSLIHLSIFSILLASGSYSYHAIRHYLALSLKEHKKTSNLVIITYIATIISTILGTLIIRKLNIFTSSIVLLILSLLAIIPIFKVKNISSSKSKDKVVINKNKIIFNILEQFKVIFIELQPLFIYLYIDTSITYIGIFNIIASISSLLVIYLFNNKIQYKYFKYYTLTLGIILILKINLNNSLILLIIAFLEGIFVKIYEIISLSTLYHNNNNNNNINNYLIKEEVIFFTTKSIIVLIYYLLNLNLYLIMLINILAIILSGYLYKEESSI